MMIRRCDRCKQKIEGEYVYVEITGRAESRGLNVPRTIAKSYDLCPECIKVYKKYLSPEDKPHED